MNIDKLRHFIQIAEMGSIAAAARGSYMSQGALSQYVQSLEGDLGCTLFERRGRNGLTLTPAGEVLCRYARELLKVHKTLKQSLSDLQQGLTGAASLGCMFYAHIFVLPDLLAQFLICYPRSSLALRVGDTEEILDLLDRHEVDLGLVWSPVDHVKYEVDVLAQDTFVFTASPRHFSFPEQGMTLAELSRYPFVFNSATTAHSTRKFVEKLMAERGAAVANVIEVGVIAAVKQHVIRGNGIGFLPLHIIQDELDAGLLTRIRADYAPVQRDLLIARARDRTLNPASLRLHEFLTTNGARILSRPG